MAETNSRPKRRTIFDELKGLAWWQIVLAVVPLALIGVGGLLGGLCGALAMLANIRIAKAGLNAAVKAIVMLGVDLLATVVWYVLASAVFDFLN